MSATRYIYHFCAEWSQVPGILRRFDGIADMAFKVLDMDGYRALKDCVAGAAEGAPSDSALITILSLTLVGAREVKGGEG